MSNKIKTHAVRQYLVRIRDVDPRMATNTEWNDARCKINEAIKDPDRVVQKSDDLPQIHLKGDMAVPVGVPGDGQGEYEPYDSSDDVKWVPTVYSVKSFAGGKYDGTRKQGA
jgi:hypothetical protein